MLRPVLGRILAKVGPKTVDKTGPKCLLRLVGLLVSCLSKCLFLFGIFLS